MFVLGQAVLEMLNSTNYTVPSVNKVMLSVLELTVVESILEES